MASKKKSSIKFTDGMEIQTDGEYRTMHKSDGLYVVGHGMCAPVRDDAVAQELITKLKAEEVVPPTVVEATEAEVFAAQTEGQEAAPEVVVQPEKPVEAPQKEKVNKRPYISFVEEHLNSGDMGKREILASIIEKFPAVSKGGVSTFLTDLKNAKYRHWKDREVVQNAFGKLQFADKVVPVEMVVAPEPVTGVEPSEQPAE